MFRNSRCFNLRMLLASPFLGMEQVRHALPKIHAAIAAQLPGVYVFHRSPLTLFASWSLACNSDGTYFFKSCHARSRVCVLQLSSSYILVFWEPAALTPFGSVTDLANCNKEWFTDSKGKPEDSAALRHDFAPSANKMVPSLRTLRIKSLLRPEALTHCCNRTTPGVKYTSRSW